MRYQVIIALLVIPALLSGCAESDIETPEGTLGCTYPDAMNYNSTAIVDDGTCVYPEAPQPVLGCMYQGAINFNQAATEDDGSCRYPVVSEPTPGCTYSDAVNFDVNATEDDGSCVYDSDGDGILDDFETMGCVDPNANNFNSSSTDDDGSCDYDEDKDGVYDWAEKEGCMDTNATNYDPSATQSNLTMCTYPYILSLLDFQALLDDPEEIIDLSELSNVTSFVKIVDVSVSSEEEGMEIDSNANTTGLEMIMGHDPTNQTVYQSMVLRFMGDIQMEQTTLQGPDGINYRIGSSSSGSWYYARDEVYEYENPFQDDEEGSGEPSDDEGEGENYCDEFIEEDPFSWGDGWNITHIDGMNIAVSMNDSRGVAIRMELIGSSLNYLEISEVNGMARCSIEVMDPSRFSISVDTSLPRTSMTMIVENEVVEESGSTKTWSGDLSEEHFEEVDLAEIAIRVVYTDEDGGSIVASMPLSAQSMSFTDQCFQWTLSWSDSDNDGFTSTGDAYTASRAEKLIDPCAEDDDYRNKDFQIMFYDLWADMPTGGVFTPGFSLIPAVFAIIITAIIHNGKRD